MSLNWTDKRREFRFLLKGSFSRMGFRLGSNRVMAVPIDISRTGLGLLVDTTWHPESNRGLSLEFGEAHAPIMLIFRFVAQELEGDDERAWTRCGLELSEMDKHRGIDLIALLSREPHLSLHLSA